MANLPHGTVTFAFTDIEGSTGLLKRLGSSGYGEILSVHRRLIRDAFTAHGGVEIDTQGDAFFFAFPRARDAIAAAASTQRDHAAHEWPPGAAVRTRIGLHTGEPTISDEGYLGLDVVRAARLCGVCDGGHVLLSETTRALVASSLPNGVSVFPVGERHLKDIDEPERVYELEIEGADFSPELQIDEVALRDIPPPPVPPTPVPASKERQRRLSRIDERPRWHGNAKSNEPNTNSGPRSSRSAPWRVSWGSSIGSSEISHSAERMANPGTPRSRSAM